MILEKMQGLTYKSKQKITRICDECAKSDTIDAYAYVRCQKYRHLKKDLCRSCAGKIRHGRKRGLFGKDSKNWKHGINKGYRLVSMWDENKQKVTHKPEHRWIYENYLGRALFPSEKIHHIDMDKLNNNVDNLYLCNGEKEHQFLHSSLEKTGFLLFDRSVFFDYTKNEYSSIETEHPSKKYIPENLFYNCTLYNKIVNKNQKYMFCYNRKNKSVRLMHIVIMEYLLGRGLLRRECVHHIDGNKINNDVNNLKLMTISEHMKCHKSLQYCAVLFYKKDLIKFNREKGIYYLPE